MVNTKHGSIGGWGGGGNRGSGPPLPTPTLENHKAVGFLINIGLDALENHKAIKLAFDVGQLSARQENAI